MTYNSKDQDELPSVTISLLGPLDDPSQMEGKARLLADPRIAKHLEEMAPIKPKVSLSCEECTYRTNNLPWKMAKRRMLNHKRKHHHRDPNNNPVKALTKEFAEETEQRTNVGKEVAQSH